MPLAAQSKHIAYILLVWVTATWRRGQLVPLMSQTKMFISGDRQPQAESGGSRVQGWTLQHKELCLKTKCKDKQTEENLAPEPDLAQQQSTSQAMRSLASIQSCKIAKTDKQSL